MTMEDPVMHYRPPGHFLDYQQHQSNHNIDGIGNPPMPALIDNELPKKKRERTKKAPKIKEKKHKCDLCEKAFTQRVNLRDHVMAVHDKLKPFECETCGKKFSQKQNLNKHTMIHLGPEEKAAMAQAQRLFKCEYCDKTYYQRSTLHVHVRSIHEGKRDFVCEYCDKKFPAKGALKVHIKGVHEKALEYPCEHCDKRFNVRSSLWCHVKMVHIAKRDYKCNHCDSSFKISGALATHMRQVHMQSVRPKRTRKQRIEDPIKCAICGMMFAAKRSMMRHVKNIHENQKEYRCKRCGERFANGHRLYNHVSKVHGVDREAHMKLTNNKQNTSKVCPLCGMFNCKKCLVGQEEEVESDGNRKCWGCGNEIENQICPARQLEPTSDLDSECKNCDKYFGRRGALSRHVESVLLTRLEHDDYIKEEDFGEDLFQVSMKVETGSWKQEDSIIDDVKPFECELCAKRFRRERNVVLHIDFYHNKKNMVPKSEPEVKQLKKKRNQTGDGKFHHTCEVCGKSFDRPINLKRHFKSLHSDVKDIPCEICDQMFKSKKARAIHKRNDHDIWESVHPCDYCDRKFLFVSDKNTHVKRLHLGIKNHQCTHCDKMFETPSRMQRHVRLVHEGRRDYACNQCDKVFALDLALKAHIKVVHQGIKPDKIQCDHCDKLFGDRHKMKMHVNAVHLGIKDKQCQYCDKAFSYTNSLNSHLRKFHKINDGPPIRVGHVSKTDLPYNVPCSHDGCTSMFTTTNNMKSHVSKVHSNRIFRCPFCDKTRKVRRGMRIHMKQAHQAEDNVIEQALGPKLNAPKKKQKKQKKPKMSLAY